MAKKLIVLSVVLMLQGLCYSEVEMLECNGSKVNVRTGGYMFSYTKNSGQGAFIRRVEHSDQYMPDSIVTDFISGKDFDLLNEGKTISK